MKKLAILSLFFFSSIIIGKTKFIVSKDTTWYDSNYKESVKENAIIYKARPYNIKDRYIHVYNYKSTHKNHLISYSLDFYDSQLDGKRTYYFANGNVNYVEIYKNNVKEGPYIEYYENAKVFVQGKFHEGKKDGEFIINNKDGSIRAKEYWSNGVKIDKLANTKLIPNKKIANK